MPKKGGGGGGKGEGQSKAGRVAPKIECMAWNEDYSEVALGVGKDIVIFGASSADKKQWTKVAELENAHGLDISGLDWSPVNNKIVSASHDRNAYVWTRDAATSQWKPTLAILRISRAALCCKWSPNGKKFAVGSGSKTVPVCQFDREQDWWNSKIINKKRGSNVQHKSSIVDVAWHPNSQFLATACADKKCRVWCAHFEALDGPLDVGDMADFIDGDAEEVSFGDPLFEFAGLGWVHACAFSPSGKQLAFVAHDSTVTVVNFGETSGKGDSLPLQTVLPYRGLPFTSCLFTTEDQVVAAGYDFFPIRINGDGNNQWSFGKPVDAMKAKASKKAKTAMSVFQNRDTLGQDTKVQALLTKHQAAVRCLRFNAKTGTLYSGGSDGRLQFWTDL